MTYFTLIYYELCLYILACLWIVAVFFLFACPQHTKNIPLVKSYVMYSGKTT